MTADLPPLPVIESPPFAAFLGTQPVRTCSQPVLGRFDDHSKHRLRLSMRATDHSVAVFVSEFVRVSRGRSVGRYRLA